MRAPALVALLCFAVPLAARADDEPPPTENPPPAVPPAPPPARNPDDRSHYHQFGVAVTAGTGYRVMFKYSSASTCNGMDNNATCYYRAPAFLDAKVFFGVTKSVDLVVEQRFGLETDFFSNHDLLLMPGIRIYPDAAQAFKFYVQIQLVIDFSDVPNNITTNHYDFGFHEANGFQWDFLRWMGAYLQISETFGFVRSFNFQLEAGAGLEGRFP